MNGKTAFVFPGGGSQEPRALDPFAEQWPEIERLLHRYDHDGLESLLFEADADALNDLVNMHRALVATGLVVADVVRTRFDAEPDVVAGHSLGHVTALPVAGMLSPADAIEFAAERGRALALGEERAGPGKMVAVTLPSPETIESVVEDIDGVSVGVYNGPRQTVVSGHEEAVEAARERIDAAVGRVRMKELDVATASHSPVMEPAVERLREAVDETDFDDPDAPIVSDVTGERYDTATATRAQLPKQLVEPVRWQSVVETLEATGVERVVEFPPGDGVLADLVSRIAPELESVAISEPADAEEVFADDG